MPPGISLSVPLHPPSTQHPWSSNNLLRTNSCCSLQNLRMSGVSGSAGSGGSGGSRRFGDGKVPPGKPIKKEPKDRKRRSKSSGRASPNVQHQREQQGLPEEEGDAAQDVQRIPQRQTRTQRGRQVETQPPMFDTEDAEIAEDIRQYNRQEDEQQQRQSQSRRPRQSQVRSLLSTVRPFMSCIVLC